MLSCAFLKKMLLFANKPLFLYDLFVLSRAEYVKTDVPI